MHIEDAAPRHHSVTPWLLPCECWAVACARVCGPGGAVCRGTFSRTEERSSSISVLVVCMIAGIVYDYRYQGHTIEERWTSIVVDSDFVEQYPRWSATHSCRYARRSLSVVHATKEVSIRYRVGTSSIPCYAGGNHNPCRTVCRHWLS